MGILARSKAFKQSRDLPVACRDSKVRLVEVCADEYATRRSRENRFQSALSEGRVPSSEIQDGLMIVFAAALLLTPGLLTDAIGFTLLVPQGRELVRKTLLRRYMEKFQMRFYGPEDFTENSFQQNNEDCSQTIDADHFERKPD